MNILRIYKRHKNLKFHGVYLTNTKKNTLFSNFFYKREKNNRKLGLILVYVAYFCKYTINLSNIIFTYEVKYLEDFGELEKFLNGIFIEEINEGKRKDYTDLNIVTIDQNNTKIFEDAIHIEKKENSNLWVFGVHISDVSEIKNYIKMFKKEYSIKNKIFYVGQESENYKIWEKNFFSLNEYEKKPAFSMFYEINNDGKIIRAELKKTFIKVKKAFTFEEAGEVMRKKNLQYHLNLIKMRYLIIKIKDMYEIVTANHKKKIKGKIETNYALLAREIVTIFMSLTNQTVHNILKKKFLHEDFPNHCFTAPLKTIDERHVHAILSENLTECNDFLNECIKYEQLKEQLDLRLNQRRAKNKVWFEENTINNRILRREE